jgi:hypothetical protein
LEYDSPNPDSVPIGVTERAITTERSVETTMITPEMANSNRSGFIKNVNETLRAKKKELASVKYIHINVYTKLKHYIFIQDLLIGITNNSTNYISRKLDNLTNIVTNVNIQRHNEFVNLSKSMEYFYDKLTGYLNEIVKKEEQVFTLLHFLLDDLLNLYNYLDLDDEQRY